MTAITAGAAYFAIVFAIGFILGTIRVLLLAPTLGDTTAVLIETPFILTASWIVCGYVIRKISVPADLSARITMGAVALGLLLAAETVLGVTAFGRTLNDIAAQYATAAGALGLAGQIVFAAFPLMRARPGR